MSDHFGVPGVGGSSGMCALCGESFVAEILLGRNVRTFKQAGSSTTFCAHDKCLEAFNKPGLTMLDLPAASPLRQAYERQESARNTERSASE